MIFSFVFGMRYFGFFAGKTVTIFLLPTANKMYLSLVSNLNALRSSAWRKSSHAECAEMRRKLSSFQFCREGDQEVFIFSSFRLLFLPA
jgi:hypothetical protein